MLKRESRDNLMRVIDLAAAEADTAGYRTLADRLDEAREAMRVHGEKAEAGVFRELARVFEIEGSLGSIGTDVCFDALDHFLTCATACNVGLDLAVFVLGQIFGQELN